jgi:hypothetical protein
MGVGLISFQIINDLILAGDIVKLCRDPLPLGLNRVAKPTLSSPWIRSAHKFWAYFAREQSLG